MNACQIHLALFRELDEVTNDLRLSMTAWRRQNNANGLLKFCGQDSANCKISGIRLTLAPVFKPEKI